MDYKTYLKSKKFSQSSIKTYQMVSNRFNKWLKQQQLPLSEVCYNDIMAYINHLQSKRHKQRTIQLEIGALKHYLNYQQAIGNVDRLPLNHLKIQGVKRQGIYDILTPEELDYIYQNYPNNYQENTTEKTPIESRNKIIIGLLVYQGLTTTDLSNLKVEHLQLHRGTIEIPPTKKSNGRTLKLQPHQAIELQHYILVEREQLIKQADKLVEEQLIFSLGIGHKIYNLLHQLMDTLKAQYPEIKNAKQIRASVITNWLKVHNLRETQYRAGHRYVSSTENYKINDIETLKNDITQFSPNI